MQCPYFSEYLDPSFETINEFNILENEKTNSIHTQLIKATYIGLSVTSFLSSMQ